MAGVGPAALAAPPIAGAPEIAIADTDASYETNSLYRYLLDQQGQGALFGHQHTTDNGITFSEADGVNSDVFAGTGDYPGIFGWDTLILEGLESPGTPANTPEQNVQAFADGMINADRLGGINTVSAHMRNFVTGNDFTDTAGRVVSQILPGAPKNAEFNAYLDLIAATADATVDADGNLIPIIFRPFHENTGSWFWWGAAHATAGEYKEIFRYTVEYLRDTKGVSNLLYAYSPNGSFGGDPTRYLDTYPGDAWVDILGYDSYENSNEPENSDAWIATVIPDLAMVSDLADERGKIAAFTEFGRNGDRTIKPTGNKSLSYYTDLFDAIKNDPKASRIAYALTWSNWELGQFYVPYPAYPGGAEHEMFQDFLAFYNDPYSIFASDIPADADERDANAIAAQPTVRVVSPADGVRLTAPTATVRVKATTAVPDRVYFTVGSETTERELALDASGYYSAEWEIGEDNLDNSTVAITAFAEYAGQPTLESSSTVILGTAAVLPLGVVDDFEGYSDDAGLRSAFTFNNVVSSDLSLSDDAKGTGEYGARFSYDFAARNYGGFGKVFPEAQDWTSFNQVNAWLNPDGSNQKLVLQVNTTNGQSFEAYPSLAGTEPTEVAIDFLDFRAKSDPKRSLTATDLVGVKEFWIYINQVGEPSASSIVLDDIRAVSGDAEPTLPVDPEEPTDPGTPGLVDDFEGYADDAALRAGWSRPGAATLSLSADVKAAGEFGAAFPFTPAFDEFQRTIGADWSGFDELRMWVKPDGTEQKVVIQLVAGGFYYDAATVVSGTEPVEVAIPFSTFTPASFQGRDPALRPSPAELADAQQFVMFIEPTENSTSETGTYYLDEIRAAVADEPEPEPVPADSTTSLSISKQILFSWQRARVTVTVASDGESVPTGEVKIMVGGKTYRADVDSTGVAKFTLPKLRQGIYSARATYLGDENTEVSTSRSRLMVVLF